MNKLILKGVAMLMLAFACSGSAFAGGDEVFPHKKVTKNAKFFAKDAKWKNNFGALPDKSVDLQEFYEQYQMDPEQFEKAFEWLATHNLYTIEAGKYKIEGTDLTVSVEDSENKPLSERRSESHYKHIDFQYVVKGTEGFRLLNHVTSQPNCKYDAKKDVIHYDFESSDLKVIESKPFRFMLFMPNDWHIAKVMTDKEDQNIRVIVIKLKYHEVSNSEN